MISEIKTIEEFEVLTQQEGVVIIHFWAIWNQYDQTAKVILKDLEKEFGELIMFGFLNIDEEHFWKLLKQLNVRGVPSFAYFRDGNKIKLETGLRTKEDFREIINAIIHN